MKKRIIGLLVVGLLLFGNIGCGPGESEYVEHEKTPFGKYEEALSLTTMKYLPPSLATSIAQLANKTGETLQDNRWIREFKSKLNIDVSYVLDGSGDAFYNQWAGLMAGGEIPDFFPVGLADYSELVENDMIWDMTELYETYESPVLKTVLGEAGSSVTEAITIDGKVYGIPQPVSQYDSYSYLWIRRDWMAKVGVTKAPETIEELIDLMGKFVAQKPGGKTPTYAFPLENDLWYNLEGFFAMYGAYPDSWILDADGKLKLGAIDDAMTEPLNEIARMIRENWIDREFVTTSHEQGKTMIASGSAGIYMGSHFSAQEVLLPSINADPTADWAVFPWPVKDGKTYRHQLELGMNDVMVVSKKCQNPEALFKLMNVYFENLYGETGDYDKWGNAEVDLIWGMGPFFSYRPEVNSIPYNDVQKVLRGEMEASALKGVSKNYYKNAIVDAKHDWNIMFGSIPDSRTFTVNGRDITVIGGNTAGYYLDQVVKGEITTFINYFTGPPTPAMISHGIDLGSLSLTYFTNAISGTKNATTDFVSYRDSWLNGGGTTITGEANAWYKS
jgi:putative aldouronate transport system substrate-binding protein